MSGSSRVSIPSSVRKTIQDIKEITGKHSDEDIYAMLKECNMDPNETAQKLLYLDTFHEVKRKRDRRKLNVSSRASEEYRWMPGVQWRGARGGRGNYSSAYVSDDASDRRNFGAQKENGVYNRTERGSRPSMLVLHKAENCAKPCVANSSTVSVNGLASISNGSSGDVPVPQLSPVGTIKCEISSEHTFPESNATLPVGSRSNTAQDVANNSQATSGVLNSTNSRRPRNSQGDEENQLSEPSKRLPLPTHNGSLAVSSNQDSWPPQEQNSPSKGVGLEPAAVVVANSHSLTELNDSILEEATSKLDIKLEKLKISAHQHVIIPDHLQVPEAFKNGLTFGSLDATFGGKSSAAVAEFIQGHNEIDKEPSMNNQNVPSSTHEGDYPDQPQSPPHVSEHISPLEDNVSAGAVLKYDQSKQDTMLSLGGPQYAPFQTVPDYSFGFVPPVLGPHLVQLEGPELQSGNSLVPSTSGSTPPAGVGQNSIAVSPQFFPFFRQPYTPNYFPYGPYFPHIYLPQNAYQFLSRSGFPQQPSSGGIYVPPAAAAPGVKFAVPPPYKPGTKSGNLTHFGILSGYGSYSSSPLGYSPSAAVNAGSSAGNEDLAASELKEKNIYSTVQQSEDSHVWNPAPSRDISSLQANNFYNFPQGQHVAFSPAQAGHGAFAGIYHLTQTAAASSTVQPILQQSQAMVAPVESLVPPSGAYQQPQPPQINWNTKLLNRENI